MKDKQYLDNLRHSTAHLLAAAVLELYPQALRTIGPSIENGFYYDFDFGDIKISEDDLPKIEKKMHEIAPTWKSFEHREVSADEAKEEYKGNPYKIELIEEFSGEGQTLTFYKSGNYEDLCRGGHVENPSDELKHFKLLSIAGAYWRGDEKNQMLTRIYGTAFPTEKELADYLVALEEAKKRDHRKLGKELELFIFSDLVGPGLPLYAPKGFAVRSEIVNYSRYLNSKIGFQEVHTPNINKAELFKTSGHYDKYKDDMLEVKSHYSDEVYYMKPMNCPQHTQIYASKTRSYRDLPIRYSDFANLYRDEKPGELSGLIRLRYFAQDDGHSFCREDQIGAEFESVLSAVKEALDTYGLPYYICLSLQDPNNKQKYLGDDAVWEKAQSTLRELLVKNKIEFTEAEGEAAFYGPKMDIMARDSLGREHQISTIQLDFNMPGRFKLAYIAEDGSEKTPVMIHRAIIGSPDRLLGILIEHYGGAFPVWLAPVQVQILPITDRNIEYAEKVSEKLKEAGARVEIDTRSETLQSKIRDAQLQKVPYMVILGDKEEQNDTVSVRLRSGENTGATKLEEVIARIKSAIDTRSLEL